MIIINEKQYKELRCAKCQKFIIYQNVSAGILCIQCPRCDFLNEWTFKYLKSDDNDVMIKKYEIESLKGGE
jgi:phage FluMu protein Com